MLMQPTKINSRKQLDPARTRADILDGALRCFAEKGFSGASIEDIARSANVTKSLVLYHFGTKQELWHACIGHRAAPVIAAIDRLLAGETHDLIDLVRTRFEHFREHPDTARLLFWASLESPPPPPAFAERRKRILARFGGDAGRAEIVKLIFAISSMDGWFLNRSLYTAMLDESGETERIEQRLLDCILAMVSQL
jgi:AcrR family transcriptional regulator